MADEEKKKTEEKDQKTLAAVEADAKDEKKEEAEDKSGETEKPKKETEEKKTEEPGDKKEETTKPETEKKKEDEADSGEEKEGEEKSEESGEKKTEDKGEDEKKNGEEVVDDKDEKNESGDGEEPKKKRFGFGFGKKKDKKDEAKSDGDKPAEVKGEMAQLIKEFELAQEVNQKMEDKADFFVVKIKKSVVMLILGLLVIAMWAVPMSKVVKLYMSQKGISISLPFLNKTESSPEASNSAQLQDQGPKIRIRDSSKTQDGVLNLAAVLENAGFTSVEVQTDTENEYDGVGLIVKPGEDALREQIMKALADEYEVGSPSAELTADSDFDAVILFGKDSKVKGETDVVRNDATPSAEATDSGNLSN